MNPVPSPVALPRNERSSSPLRGGSPAEILARIVDGDPLGMRAMVGQRLRERALWMDADPIHLRALARAAHAAARRSPRGSLEDWLRERADEAIEDALGELASTPPGGGAHHELAGPLGLDGQAMLRACERLNAAPERERRWFQRLVVEGESLEQVARESGRSLTSVARTTRRLLARVLASALPEGASMATGSEASPSGGGA